jgi:hypothetical protein
MLLQQTHLFPAINAVNNYPGTLNHELCKPFQSQKSQGSQTQAGTELLPDLALIGLASFQVPFFKLLKNRVTKMNPQETLFFEDSCSRTFTAARKPRYA